MEILLTDELKKCYTCKKEKPKSTAYFAIDRSTKDGLCNYCKNCKNAKARQAYWKSRKEIKGKHFHRPCDKCIFEPRCAQHIWIPSWWPYCFTTSINHDLYIMAYGKDK